MDLKKISISNFSIKADIEFLNSPFLEENLFNILPFSKFKKNIFLDKDFKKNNPTCYLNEINNLNYRSESFTNIHNGLHIVFSGCSNTFGIGLSYDETWSYKTYVKIKNKQKTSGYYNLAIPGNSFFHCIFDIFRYIKNFGNPDFIFLNLPSLNRFYSYDNNNVKFLPAFYKKESIDVICLLAFQYYFILEQYCSSNKIKLFSFSWAENENEEMKKHYEIAKINNFKTWFSIDKNDLNIFLDNFYKENKINKYARDGAHPGLGHHEYWSNFIYNKAIGD